MKFSLTIDRQLDEGSVDVVTPVIDATVTAIEELARQTDPAIPRVIVGYSANQARILDFAECLAFFTKDRRVWVATSSGTWQVKLRLYELENFLPRTSFVQISQSAIVNMDAITHLDLSYTGTISVHLKNDMHFFVSRRQLSAFKRALDI